jgi:hypothetical protein
MLTEKELINLADSMAAAASQMGMMGYDQLIQCRQQLVDNVHEIFEIIGLNKDPY